MMEEAQKQAIREQIEHYAKLNRINGSPEFEDFFSLLMNTVADKMIWAFTGDNIKDMNDFYKVRGEIISYLYPIQQIKGADAMSRQLNEQLNSYYNETA